MKKHLIIIALLLVLITGCSKKEDNSKGPKKGDLIDYNSFLTVKTISLESNKTGSKDIQEFETNNELEWVVLSNNNGTITITPTKNIVTTNNKGLGLNKQDGYLNGVETLDELCNTLYSSEIGNARSMKAEDILSLADEKDKKLITSNAKEITFKQGTFYDGEKFTKISSPLKVEHTALYYSFSKPLKLSDILFKDTKSTSTSIYENTNYLWLANRGVRLYKDANNENMNTAEYAINYFSGNLIGNSACFTGDAYEGHIDQTKFYGVRPVVELASSLEYKEENSNSKKIWKIIK